MQEKNAAAAGPEDRYEDLVDELVGILGVSPPLAREALDFARSASGPARGSARGPASGSDRGA